MSTFRKGELVRTRGDKSWEWYKLPEDTLCMVIRAMRCKDAEEMAEKRQLSTFLVGQETGKIVPYWVGQKRRDNLSEISFNGYSFDIENDKISPFYELYALKTKQRITLWPEHLRKAKKDEKR